MNSKDTKFRKRLEELLDFEFGLFIINIYFELL